tara:strand:+ start:7221 stop:8264 length:1044 start_codon:yes stop_codon:yes gene_type:complete
MGFKEANTQLPTPNYKDVFRLLDDEQIFQYYIPGLTLNTSMLSPIGKADRHPSFSVFWSYRKHKFIFKEHRYGYTGDCIDFVRYFYGYHNNAKACMKIFKDFGISGYRSDDDIINPSTPFDHKTVIKKLPKKTGGISIRVKVREWNKNDLDYWGKYGITLDWLKLGDIYPIEYYYLNNSMRRADKLAYAYIERKDGKITYKIYQPYNLHHRKWISNNNASVWELWSKLPSSHDFLIITKSRKDALSVMATTGIPATSLQAEGTIPKEHVVDVLRPRFKHIFLLYDNDYDSDVNWGQNYCQKLSETFDLPYLTIPSKLKAKDYTDYIDKYSIKEAKNMLWNLIKQKLL